MHLRAKYNHLKFTENFFTQILYDKAASCPQKFDLHLLSHNLQTFMSNNFFVNQILTFLETD
jgi:hypothetical protein